MTDGYWPHGGGEVVNINASQPEGCTFESSHLRSNYSLESPLLVSDPFISDLIKKGLKDKRFTIHDIELTSTLPEHNETDGFDGREKLTK